MLRHRLRRMPKPLMPTPLMPRRLMRKPLMPKLMRKCLMRRRPMRGPRKRTERSGPRKMRGQRSGTCRSPGRECNGCKVRRPDPDKIRAQRSRRNNRCNHQSNKVRRRLRSCKALACANRLRKVRVSTRKSIAQSVGCAFARSVDSSGARSTQCKSDGAAITFQNENYAESA